MELLFIVAFAAYGMYSNTRAEFTGWGRRKLDAGRSRIAAKRAAFRPGGRYRSRTGRARLRDFPARSWWSFADVTWSFGRAVKTGAVAGAKDGRDRYRSRVQPVQDTEPEDRSTGNEKDPHASIAPPGAARTGIQGAPLECCRCGGGLHSLDPKFDYDAGGYLCDHCKPSSARRNDELAQRRAARPAPIPVLAIPATAAAAATTGGTMTDASSFEQVGAMLDDMKSAALFALEDAQNDLKRAQDDASSAEAMVAFSQSITAGPSYEQPLARTGETSGAMTKAKEDAVAAAEAHVAAIDEAITANLRMME